MKLKREAGVVTLKKKMYEIFLYAYCLSSNLDNKKKKQDFIC